MKGGVISYIRTVSAFRVKSRLNVHELAPSEFNVVAVGNPSFLVTKPLKVEGERQG